MILSILQLSLKMVEENKQAQAALIIMVILGSAFIGGSVVFFDPFEDEIKIGNSYFLDLNGNNHADTYRLKLKNRSNTKVIVDKISIFKYDLELEWSYNDSIEIKANEFFIVVCQADNITQELHYFDLAVIKLNYNDKEISYVVRISIEFANLNFIYGNNFQEKFDYLNWTQFLFRNLTGYPVHGEEANIKSWTRKRDMNEYDRCLMCITGNCQFIVLNTSQFNFDNFNLTVDVRRHDNDGVGVILRYSEVNGIPRFYLLWHTSDHPTGDEYLEEEAHLFNWTTEDDIVEFSKITLHYVEGYDTGNGIIGFMWTKLNSSSCLVNDQWNNWLVKLDGSNFSYAYDQSELFTYNNLTMTNGSIGLVCFESFEVGYDNLFIW
jgi:hypothetical protein